MSFNIRLSAATVVSVQAKRIHAHGRRLDVVFHSYTPTYFTVSPSWGQALDSGKYVHQLYSPSASEITHTQR